MDLKHLELFAGIGGFRQALTLLAHDAGIEQTTVGFSEIDISAVRSYKAAYDTEGEVELGDIVEFNKNPANIDSIPDFNFLTGGFPCQPFSMMGKQQGFGEERGTMFFQITKILKHRHPKFVLLENVRNLKNHDGSKTLDTIVEQLKDCDYRTVCYDVFNTVDFGLAQKRNRIFIFACLDEIKGFEFSAEKVRESFKAIKNSSSIITQNSVHDILRKNVDSKYYLSERIKPTILADGSKNFQSHSDINQQIARPLTATMTKMHRACQDNYYSDGFIQSDNPDKYLETTYTKEELVKQSIRKITPGEALQLQGFGGDTLKKLLDSGVSDSQLYRQAGNAVSINTVYAIMYYLFVECALR